MSAVQLIGKKAVISRFGNFDTDTWALYQGKQFIVGGVGVESLDEWLTDFEAAGSTATYMLRVYDSDAAPTASTANTDYLACINFKLVDMYEGYGIAGHTTKLMDRITGLEKKLQDQEKEGDEEGEDFNSIIMGWLSDPVKLNQVAGAVRTIFGSGGGSQQTLPATPVQAVSGFNNNSAPVTEDAAIRVAGALDILGEKDPKIVEHLEKLAKLAKNDPMIFQAVISKLDAL